jgi:hypothetical protein
MVEKRQRGGTGRARTDVILTVGMVLGVAIAVCGGVLLPRFYPALGWGRWAPEPREEGFARVRVRFVDEALGPGTLAQDFRLFREELLAAVGRREAGFVIDRLSPDILFSFGGAGGKEEFIREWRLDTDPSHSDFWRELRNVVENGGGFPEGQTAAVFEAPFTQISQSGLEDFEWGIVNRDGTILRARPDPRSKVLAMLSREDAVKIQYIGSDADITPSLIDGEPWGWLRLTTHDGTVGFAAEKYITAPLGFRARFAKVEGRWILTMFIAGD